MTERRPGRSTDGPTASTPLPSGASTERGNAASPEQVGVLFDGIADRYDLLNTLISLGQEPRWRRRAIAAARLEAGMSALDVATGTGTVAAGLADVVGTFGKVVGVDLSAAMIARARERHLDRVELEFRVGNAMALPVEGAVFDAATIAFGMRNLPDYERGFAEMRRAVRAGGRVVCLEIGRPQGLMGRAGRAWFERAAPMLGGLVGHRDAYRYLVESVRGYPPPERIADLMRAAGLVEVSWSPLTFGMITLHVGRRPQD